MITDVTVCQALMGPTVKTVSRFFSLFFFNLTYMRIRFKLLRSMKEIWIIHACCYYAFVEIYRFSVTDTDECADNPCENNGTCVDLVNAYDCICAAGFNDSNCTNSRIYYDLLSYKMLLRSEGCGEKEIFHIIMFKTSKCIDFNDNRMANYFSSIY